MNAKKLVQKNIMQKNQDLILDDSSTVVPVEIRKPSPACLEKITDQVVMATTLKGKTKEVIKENKVVASEMLNGIKPQDEIECMIAGQMIAMHNAVMTEITFSSSFASLPLSAARGMLLNQATKLNRSFTGLVETLNRYRHQDKIYQNLTVGHVDVHHGGQAVVGNIVAQ